MMPKDLTSAELRKIALERCDAAWRRVRMVLVDPDHLNNESKEYKEALEELNYGLAMSFRMKGAIADAQRQLEKRDKLN